MTSVPSWGRMVDGKHFRSMVWAVVIAFAPFYASAGDEGEKAVGTPYTVGKLLVASPTMGDPRFSGSVIYMVNHDATGAMGLIVNRLLGSGPMGKFLEGFGLDTEGVAGRIRLFYGGPVDLWRPFVLHSSDYADPGTTAVDSRMSLTTGIEVLKAISMGQGPRRSLFAIGYAGWAPGQLEEEIARNDWKTAPADIDLIFGDDLDGLWERATRRSGVEI